MPATQALPLYIQISEMLIRDIHAGRLPDGVRLPPEREMAAELGISVGTLRKALADMAAKGLLDRRQGSGNYVRAGAATDSVYAFFRLELAGGGGLPTAQVLSVDAVPKPADLPDLGGSGTAHRIRRLRLLNGVPAALEEIWLDAARAPALKATDLSESLYLFYRRRLGLWIARVEDRVGVGQAPEWGVGHLACAPTAALGLVRRLGWDQTGEMVEFSTTWYDSEKVSYISRLK